MYNTSCLSRIYPKKTSFVSIWKSIKVTEYIPYITRLKKELKKKASDKIEYLLMIKNC